MSLNLKDGTVLENCRIHVLRRWRRRGHAVFHVRLENIEKKFSDFHLLCECDFETVPDRGGLRLAWSRRTRDSAGCRAKASVRTDTFWELRKASAREWRRMGTEAAILDLGRRFRNGEFLGQKLASFLYVADAVELLEAPYPEVWAAIESLKKSKKIRLTGGIFELRTG